MDQTAKPIAPSTVPVEHVSDVRRSFLIYASKELVTHDDNVDHTDWYGLVTNALNSLESVISATALPFQLTQHAVQQRNFDRHYTAERIRGLKDVDMVLIFQRSKISRLMEGLVN